MTGKHLALTFLTAMAATAITASAQAACSFKKVGELPVTMAGLRPLVPAKINGVEVRFVADSGAFISTITHAAAAKTGVPGRGSSKGVVGVSGDAAVDVGVAKTFDLAGVSYDNVTFLIGADAIGGETAGLLGQNLLGRLDVEYDFANGIIRLFSVENCADAYLAYWAPDGRAGMLPIAPRSKIKPSIIVEAKVNGQPVRALLDTGSPTSMLKLSTAGWAGIKTSSEGVQVTQASTGISGRSVDTWLAPVSSFALGDEEIRNTRLRIAKLELDPADMLIGADFFLSHRIFVSNSQNRLYFTYNGGPVFRLDAAQPPPASTAPPPIKTEVAGDAPADGDAYARRGAAFAARGDFKSAFADYDKAIALDPKTARHHLGRASLFASQGKIEQALADLDAALTLDPADTTAHLRRGVLRLKDKNLAGAKADFDAALAAPPADPIQELGVANLYADNGYYPESVAQFGHWIANHPNDKKMTIALNGRCWARGRWGQELDQGLADCETAVRLGRRDPAILDSRALVRLRLGQLDAALADYNDAIRADPKAAWSLYGRGLTHRKLGQKAEADADIAAAVALDPKLPELAKSYGLEPGPAS